MMNETEIVEYLKENRNKGIAFDFMPNEVRNWCSEHRDEEIFSIFHHSNWNGKCGICCRDNAIYCLVEDYEQKPQFKPYLQEFEIDEDGYFYFNDKRYYYREDARFETENRDKFRGFGGWLYERKDFELWTTTPHLLYGGHLYDSFIRSDQNAYDERTVPIPIKICFWRYKE